MKLPPRNRANVPAMVRQHYRKPVELLPSLRNVLRLENVKRRSFDYDIKDVLIKTENVRDRNAVTDETKKEEQQHRNGTFRLGQFLLLDETKRESECAENCNKNFNKNFNVLNGGEESSSCSSSTKTERDRGKSRGSESSSEENFGCGEESLANSLPVVQQNNLNSCDEMTNCFFNGAHNEKNDNCYNDISDLSGEGNSEIVCASKKQFGPFLFEYRKTNN